MKNRLLNKKNILVFILLVITAALCCGIGGHLNANHYDVIVKLIDHNTSTTNYYTLHRNGGLTDNAVITDESITHSSNQLFTFNHQFTTENIIATRYSDKGITYIDEEDNQYNQIPKTTDEDLLTIEDDFFKKLPQLYNIRYRIFRDYNTIFVAGLKDYGFGRSSIEFYAYEIENGNLQHLATLSNITLEEISGIYFHQ